jgi:hypothetical protein
MIWKCTAAAKKRKHFLSPYSLLITARRGLDDKNRMDIYS